MLKRPASRPAPPPANDRPNLLNYLDEPNQMSFIPGGGGGGGRHHSAQLTRERKGVVQLAPLAGTAFPGEVVRITVLRRLQQHMKRLLEHRVQHPEHRVHGTSPAAHGANRTRLTSQLDDVAQEQHCRRVGEPNTVLPGPADKW